MSIILESVNRLVALTIRVVFVIDELSIKINIHAIETWSDGAIQKAFNVCSFSNLNYRYIISMITNL